MSARNCSRTITDPEGYIFQCSRTIGHRGKHRHNAGRHPVTWDERDLHPSRNTSSVVDGAWIIVFLLVVVPVLLLAGWAVLRP